MREIAAPERRGYIHKLSSALESFRWLHDTGTMHNAAITAPHVQAPQPSGHWPGVDRIATDYVARWLEQCRSFLGWHRELLIRRTQTPDVLEGSDRLHPWMIRATRLMHCQLLDPEFAHPDLARGVEATLWQLEEAWAQTHNPMSDNEADTLIASVFPPHAS